MSETSVPLAVAMPVSVPVTIDLPATNARVSDPEPASATVPVAAPNWLARSPPGTPSKSARSLYQPSSSDAVSAIGTQRDGHSRSATNSSQPSKRKIEDEIDLPPAKLQKPRSGVPMEAAHEGRSGAVLYLC